jgi:hypothetical protein
VNVVNMVNVKCQLMGTLRGLVLVRPNGFGALLAFELDGRFRGTLTEDDRIADTSGRPTST